METKYYCYLLKNNTEEHKNLTYNGFTVNLDRRIRQHNQIIKGGALYTKKYGNKTWEIYAYITGFPNKINALQCEWRIKHPDNKKKRGNKYNSPEGRIKGLVEVLNLNKWTNSSTIENSTMKLDVYVEAQYINLFKVPENINVHVLPISSISLDPNEIKN